MGQPVRLGPVFEPTANMEFQSKDIVEEKG